MLESNVLTSSLEDAVSAFNLSKSALVSLGGYSEQESSESSFSLPLGVVLDVLPERYILEAANAVSRDTGVSVAVDDLFAQLAGGRITTTVAKLVFWLPADIIASEAFRDERTSVDLPLPLVVAALGTEKLAERTATRHVHYNIDNLPEPFESFPSPVPPVVDVETAAHAPEPEGGPEDPTENVPEEPHDGVLEDAPEEVPPATYEVLERLSGINLNVATVDQLMTLNGVARGLAEAIVAYREVHGSFESIFDLREVPRLGRRRFRSITGMAYSGKGHHRREVLARLLSIPVAAVAHLPTIVRVIAEMPPFAGCVISDRDGLMLAESGATRYASAMSAVVPRMMTNLGDNIREIDDREVRSVSICTEEGMYTVLVSGNIYVSIVHTTSKLTLKQLKFIRRVAQELEWLLGHRGYVTALNRSCAK